MQRILFFQLYTPVTSKATIIVDNLRKMNDYKKHYTFCFFFLYKSYMVSHGGVRTDVIALDISIIVHKYCEQVSFRAQHTYKLGMRQSRRVASCRVACSLYTVLRRCCTIILV